MNKLEWIEINNELLNTEKAVRSFHYCIYEITEFVDFT